MPLRHSSSHGGVSYLSGQEWVGWWMLTCLEFDRVDRSKDQIKEFNLPLKKKKVIYSTLSLYILNNYMWDLTGYKPGSVPYLNHSPQMVSERFSCESQVWVNLPFKFKVTLTCDGPQSMFVFPSLFRSSVKEVSLTVYKQHKIIILPSREGYKTEYSTVDLKLFQGLLF